ncbi:hypothetical protein EDE08_103257 [Bradyrhizobium sp. R2.2-H]|jgi:hypothetical protein|uniref:hypothetical protein n=1 Tax=unclassified Bradyrhizobium TaxID=2631580 RepID=UPI001053E4FE|nr:MULTISPECIES: hypothetical protein [unclassified Bradyrhizobium]TCU75041.1 hypothetical protein EDE10_103256 [Bradyrhizobium sp. Y-H1]TCU77809.1 hypothetical protein EDE08_103257 [Bradyrhizobium sp. R2.2-H]
MKILKLGLLALLISAAPAAAQMVLDQEPARGMLKPGQTVYVKCGPGKARIITGGNNVQGKGPGRQRGPCVPMKS